MLSNANVTVLFTLLESALRAPANSLARQTLIKQIQEDSMLYTLLKEQASDNKDRARQLKARNWLIWLEQQTDD